MVYYGKMEKYIRRMVPLGIGTGIEVIFLFLILTPLIFRGTK